MLLRVAVSGKTYTLKPLRDYILGSGEEFDIPLSIDVGQSIDYLKLSYNQDEKVWYVYETNSGSCMAVDGKLMHKSSIERETNICLADRYFLILTPHPDVQDHQLMSLKPLNQFSHNAFNIDNTAIPIVQLGWKWFKIASPSDGVGIRLPAFDLNQTYAVNRDRLHDLCKLLYQKVYESVSNGKLQDAKVRLIKYSKSSLLQADTRPYLVITRDTIHGNRTTVFMRFHEFGDNLYVGLDVYSLGGVKWLTFLLRVGATLALLPSMLLVIPILPIVALWWKIFWRFKYERKLWLAIRQEHPGRIGFGPFDSDDVIMFSKCTVHLAVTTVRDVFKESGLPVDSLDEFILSINNISIDNSFKVDNRGGTISHSAVGIGSTLSD
jgi:hypothetical protein